MTLKTTHLRGILPGLFLIYALPAVIFLSIAVPPFQVTDEFAHFERADQIARGSLISSRLGGRIGRDEADFGALYREMWFHREVKQTLERADRSSRFRWLDKVRLENFQNTAQYGPLLYVPQAIAIEAGRLTELSVARTLLLTRLFNGLTACLVGFLALLLCEHAIALTFFTLLLPMTLSEFGSASQDALIISLSVLVVAIGSRVVVQNRPASTAEFATFAYVLAATTMARPSQIALAALTLLFVSRHDPKWLHKSIIAVASVAIIAAWFKLLPRLVPNPPPGASYVEQFSQIVADPVWFLSVIWTSLSDQAGWLLQTVVGRLGWLDTVMPAWYYAAAAVVFFCALLAPNNVRLSLGSAFVAGSTLLATFMAICGALYLSWTPVDKPMIDGLQGRYILPVLPLLGWLVPNRLAALLRPAWQVVVTFPIVTLVTLPGVIMDRYYGSWPVMKESLRLLLLQ